MSTHRVAAAIGLTSLLALTGCQASSKEMSFEGEIAQQSVEYSRTEAGFDSAVSAPAEPSVITTGYLSMVVDSPADTADEISLLVVDAGGRISSRSDYSPTDFAEPSSFLQVRLPSSDLEAAVAAITALGAVQEISVSTQDVSLQKVDLDARIQVLDTAITRLQELLGQAQTTADVVTIETALTERQSERDSLRSQRDYLTDQTVFATLAITLVTPADATPRDPDGFVDGLERGWLSIVAFFAGTIVWAGTLVPWVGLGLVVIAAIWAIRRINTSRRLPK